MERMDSRELGLVLARQLLDIEDLHYGLWQEGLELKLANLAIAQQCYNEMLIGQLPSPDRTVRILDIGCGTGHLLSQLLDRGYLADGITPSKDLGAMARQRLTGRAGCQARIFECRLEDLPAEQCRHDYDVALFSESFGRIPLAVSLPKVQEILKPGGLLLICDFFKTEADGDGGAGDRSFGGGHSLQEFHHQMRQTPFVLVKDEDITRQVSPNLELVNDLLMHRMKPAVFTLRRYLESNYPLVASLSLRLLSKKLDRLNYKYFSGYRSKEVFERYKTYHLLLYRLPLA